MVPESIRSIDDALKQVGIPDWLEFDSARWDDESGMTLILKRKDGMGQRVRIGSRATFDDIMKNCGKAEFTQGTLVYPIDVGDKIVDYKFGNGQSRSDREPLTSTLRIEIQPDTLYFRPALDTAFL